MFKIIGTSNKHGQTLLIGKVKTGLNFAESGFYRLLNCEAILLDDIRTIIPEAPENANFGAIINADGSVAKTYFVVSRK